MPVSTDAVLLGAWSAVSHCRHILDIGTGTGLLTLMCAQRNPTARLTSVDIDLHAVTAAEHNFTQSPWKERIQLIHVDINTLKSFPLYDGIICNPPYFNSGELAKNQQRAMARHTHSLTHTDLLNKCKEFLTNDGKANFVLPQTEGEEFIRIALDSGWFLTRLCRIRPTENKPVHRLLIELSLHKEKCTESELIIHNKQAYSDDFIALTRDFYLKM